MIDDEILQKNMHKEIDIIQDVIKRMANNSFSMKGWTITLVAATLLLKGNRDQSYISFIPLFGFWYLDAYYLWQERLYRKLYEWVIENRLSSTEYLFDMNAGRFKKKVDPILLVMLSNTLLSFYGIIIVMTIIYIRFLS